MKPAIILCTLMTLALSGLVSGCEAKQAYDCRRICDRYDECLPGDQDVSACTQECRAQEGNEFEELAAECQNCVDDRDNESCVEEAFQCADECAGITD